MSQTMGGESKQRVYVRLLTVLAILLQLVLVPAVQAQPALGQDPEGSVKLLCHPTVTADCTKGTVELTYTYQCHDLKIWVEDGAGHTEKVLLQQDDVCTGSKTLKYQYNWATEGINVCQSHVLKATWSETKSDSFGGGQQCCPSSLTITKTATGSCTGVSGTITAQNTGEHDALVTSVTDKVEYKKSGSTWYTLTTTNVQGADTVPTGGSKSWNYSVSFTPVSGATAYRNTAYVTISNHPDGTHTFQVTVSFTVPSAASCVECGTSRLSDWQEVSRGDWYYKAATDEWCQDVHYHKVDLITGKECENKTEPECEPYVDCQAGHVSDWQEVSRGDWYYKAATDEWSRTYTTTKWT